MTLAEYVELRKAEGLSLTRAVMELVSICAASERAAWRWVKGQPMPPSAARLLRVWAECTAQQRARWFETR